MVNLSLKNWLEKILSYIFSIIFRDFLLVLFVFLISPMSNAFASTTGNLPFVSAVDILKDAISGPFLLSASIIMIVVTCIMLAFGEWGDGFKKIINIVLWLSVAFAATSFITTLFGGGAVF